MLGAAGIAGLALSLASAGYLLAFNVNTLMISLVLFGVIAMAAGYVSRNFDPALQLEYAALAVVPIALRILFNMPFFQSYKFEAAVIPGIFEQVIFFLEVVGLWVIVAVAEECFRAACMILTDSAYQHYYHKPINMWLKIIVANCLWLLFHFIQRPFDPFAYKYYILWLFISGLLLGYLVEKAGLGSAALAHFLVNLTA